MKTKLNHLLTAAAFCLIGLGVIAPTVNAAERRFDTIEAFGTETWNLRLTGGTTSEIFVVGDGDTDLDAFLYDEHGNLVASDTDGTDFCILTVTPRRTGSFTLVIKNHGAVYNEYVLTITP